MTGVTFLRPCPHCGGSAGLSHADGLFWAFCTDCGASGPTGSQHYATTGWNRRPTTDSHAADALIAGIRSAGL